MRLLWAIATVAVLAGTAAAQNIAPEVQKGIALYDDLEYDKAVTALEAALGAPNLDDASKIEGYKYLALSHVALRRPNEAKDAFRRLLEIDRTYQLARSESQTARDLLDEIREAMPHEIEIHQTPSPAKPKAGSPFRVDIEVRDRDGVHRGVILYHRTRGAKDYSVVQAAPLGEGRYTATVSGAFVQQPGLDYYVVTTSASGRELSRTGSPEAPLQVVVDKATTAGNDGGSVLSSPWFWAGTGAVVIGGAVAGFLLLRSDEPPAPGAQINIVVEFQ